MAYNGLVVEGLRRPTIVLPIVSIDAPCLIVFSQVEWTEYRLVMEPSIIDALHVEIVVVFVVMDESSVDFSLTVSKRTEISVFAQTDVVWIVGTKLDFVLICPVQLFDTRMRIGALVPMRTFLALFDVFAQCLGVEVAHPLLVLGIMIVHAIFMVVWLSVVARHQLKIVDVEVLS